MDRNVEKVALEASFNATTTEYNGSKRKYKESKKIFTPQQKKTEKQNLLKRRIYDIDKVYGK